MPYEGLFQADTGTLLVKSLFHVQSLNKWLSLVSPLWLLTAFCTADLALFIPSLRVKVSALTRRPWPLMGVTCLVRTHLTKLIGEGVTFLLSEKIRRGLSLPGNHPLFLQYLGQRLLFHCDCGIPWGRGEGPLALLFRC